MNRVVRTTVFIWIVIAGNFALSQTNTCANPNAPRIGLLIQDSQATTDSGSSPRLVALSRQLVDADIELRDQLALRLPADSCIVTSRDIFNDPKNFPHLKGSTVIEIKADASFRNPGVFAFAVTVSSVGGIYVQDQSRMFTIPVLGKLCAGA